MIATNEKLVTLTTSQLELLAFLVSEHKFILLDDDDNSDPYINNDIADAVALQKDLDFLVDNNVSILIPIEERKSK